MRISLIVNPKSGRGKALAAAQSLQSMLSSRGHEVISLSARDEADSIGSSIALADRVIILGGDGTVHHLLEILASTKTPFYHFGLGTANLIAHEFDMSQNPTTVVKHLESNTQPTRIDLPRCNGHPFLIMLSIGLDASVIHRFEELRGQRGGYRAYSKPILAELFKPRPARYLLEQVSQSDHTQTNTQIRGKGGLIISNLKSYGGHFNPSPNANPCDGLLEAVTLPGSTTVHQLINYGLLRCRLNTRTMIRSRAHHFTIAADVHPIYVQVDGETGTVIPNLSDGKLMPGETLEVSIGEDQATNHVFVLDMKSKSDS